MYHIGHRLKALRKKAGLNQEELGKKAKLSGAYIGHFERQDDRYTNPRMDTINDLAKALKVHPSVLLYGKVLEPAIKPIKDGKHTMILTDAEKKLLQAYRKIRPKSAQTMAEDIVECISAKQKRKSK